MIRFVCSLLLLVSTGCAIGSVPMTERLPLPARHAAETEGGMRLDLDTDGTLVSRTPCDDLEVALGASLASVTSGVRVTSLLRAECPLRAGDKIVLARPLDPNKPDEHLKLRGLGAVTASAYAVRHTRKRGHAVRGLEDLSGYARAWVQLELLVERGGRTLRVQCEIGRPEPVAVRLWNPEETRKLGFTAARIDALPRALRPKHAKRRHHLLVTWVAINSPVAVQGLRPLMVIPRTRVSTTLLGSTQDVRRPEGGTTSVTFPADDESFTFRLGYEVVNAQRDRLGRSWRLGPSWAKVFELSSSAVYNPRTDRYGEHWVWSLADSSIVFQTSGGAGRGSHQRFAVVGGGVTGKPDHRMGTEKENPFFSTSVGTFLFDAETTP